MNQRTILRAPGGRTILRAHGVRGPAGPDGGIVHVTAARALSGHRVVCATPEGADYADAASAAAAAVIGVTLAAAAQGADAAIRYAGDIEELSWSWTAGPIFCGVGGQLTQNPPDAAFVRQVGTAVSATRIVVEPSATVLTP